MKIEVPDHHAGGKANEIQMVFWHFALIVWGTSNSLTHEDLAWCFCVMLLLSAGLPSIFLYMACSAPLCCEYFFTSLESSAWIVYNRKRYKVPVGHVPTNKPLPTLSTHPASPIRGTLSVATVEQDVTGFFSSSMEVFLHDTALYQLAQAVSR